MPTRDKFQLAMIEAWEEHILEEEEETQIEVEEEAHQDQVEEASSITQPKIHFKISLKDKGMTNLQSNVIIARNLGIIQMDVERSNMILDNKVHILSEKNNSR